MTQENEYIYVSDIAYTKAICMYNQKYNTCNKQCSSCNYNYNDAINMLPSHMQAAITRNSDAYFANLVMQKERALHNKKVNRAAIIAVCVLTVIFLVSCIGMFFTFIRSASFDNFGYDNPDYTYNYYDNTDIVYILNKLHQNLKDVTGDKIINCKDKAIIYKLLWDKEFNPNDCRIKIIMLRNLTKDYLVAHLYVEVKKDGRWIKIEPQGSSDLYELEAYWMSNKYYVLYLYDTVVEEMEWRSLIHQ